MAKIHIFERDFSGGTAGSIRCVYHVDISAVKDSDLVVTGGLVFSIEKPASENRVLDSSIDVQLGTSRIGAYLSTHPAHPGGGDDIVFNLSTPYAASITALNSCTNSSALRTQFANNGAYLSAAGVVLVVTPSAKWSISDSGRAHTIIADSETQTIAVTAETDEGESSLLADQDIAEISIQVRAVSGEAIAATRARVEALYDALEAKVKAEYTSRFKYYGTELNP